jgi:hypothetical protein
MILQEYGITLLAFPILPTVTFLPFLQGKLPEIWEAIKNFFSWKESLPEQEAAHQGRREPDIDTGMQEVKWVSH